MADRARTPQDEALIRSAGTEVAIIVFIACTEELDRMDVHPIDSDLLGALGVDIQAKEEMTKALATGAALAVDDLPETEARARDAIYAALQDVGKSIARRYAAVAALGGKGGSVSC